MTEKQTRKAKEHLSNLASAQQVAKAHEYNIKLNFACIWKQ